MAGVLVALIGGLLLLWTARGRDPIIFEVEPGTTQTFPAAGLIPEDRFSCHGGIVPEHGAGYGAVNSDGTSIMTDTDGTVTVECPDHRENL
jgi:hypothetical protein